MTDDIREIGFYYHNVGGDKLKGRVEIRQFVRVTFTKGPTIGWRVKGHQEREHVEVQGAPDDLLTDVMAAWVARAIKSDRE